MRLFVSLCACSFVFTLVRWKCFPNICRCVAGVGRGYTLAPALFVAVPIERLYIKTQRQDNKCVGVPFVTMTADQDSEFCITLPSLIIRFHRVEWLMILFIDCIESHAVATTIEVCQQSSIISVVMSSRRHGKCEMLSRAFHSAPSGVGKISKMRRALLMWATQYFHEVIPGVLS